MRTCRGSSTRKKPRSKSRRKRRRPDLLLLMGARLRTVMKRYRLCLRRSRRRSLKTLAMLISMKARMPEQCPRKLNSQVSSP